MSEQNLSSESVVKFRVVALGLFLAQLIYITFFMTRTYLEVAHKIQECHHAQQQLSKVFNELTEEMAMKRESIYYINELKRRVEKLEVRCDK